MEAACATPLAALHRCKAGLGLLPRQCYPQMGYKGDCDWAEFEWKKCLASANAQDAAVLYDARAARGARVAANQRLQKSLRKFNQPCTP